MKEEILQNINDPEGLETLFRKDRTGFTLNFQEASCGIDTDLVRFWKIRLKKEIPGQARLLVKTDLSNITILFVVIALLVKAYLLFGDRTMEEFWGRNLPMIAFAGLTAWFILKKRVTGIKNILMLIIPVLILALFINLLPVQIHDTTILACIHAPIFMWFIFGLAWISLEFTETPRISAFIRYNGELITMYGLLCIAGAILSGMTIGLFNVIGKDIGKIYMENIA